MATERFKALSEPVEISMRIAPPTGEGSLLTVTIEMTLSSGKSMEGRIQLEPLHFAESPEESLRLIGDMLGRGLKKEGVVGSFLGPKVSSVPEYIRRTNAGEDVQFQPLSV